MNDFHFRLGDLADTRRFALALAAELKGGTAIGLSGPLGAGKTEFVRSLAVCLGIKGAITSPTFVLEAVYACPPFVLHHWDLYRLRNFCEESFQALSELIADPLNIVMIEWPERMLGLEDLLSFKINIDFIPLSVDTQHLSEERILKVEGVDDPNFVAFFSGMRR